jgi:hypothetical protein
MKMEIIDLKNRKNLLQGENNSGREYRVFSQADGHIF